MATNTAQVLPPARRDPRQVLNTLKKTVNFNDVGIADGLPFDNSLPEGANIIDVQVEIVTVFNAVSSNVLTVGTVGTAYNNMVAAGDVDEAATGVTKVSRGLGIGLAAAAAVTPYVKYVQTGDAATTGRAVVTICYEAGGNS